MTKLLFILALIITAILLIQGRITMWQRFIPAIVFGIGFIIKEVLKYFAYKSEMKRRIVVKNNSKH